MVITISLLYGWKHLNIWDLGISHFNLTKEYNIYFPHHPKIHVNIYKYKYFMLNFSNCKVHFPSDCQYRIANLFFLKKLKTFKSYVKNFSKTNDSMLLPLCSNILSDWWAKSYRNFLLFLLFAPLFSSIFLIQSKVHLQQDQMMK